MASRIAHFCTALALISALSACGASRKSAYLEDRQAAKADTAPVATEGPSLREQADEAWAQRDSKEQLAHAIELYEKALASNPSDPTLLTRLARACYFMGNGHSSGEEQLTYYDKGASYGERGMALNAAFKKAIADGKSDKEALELLSKDEVGAIYWTYSNLGKWSVAKGFATVLKNKSKLKAFVDRVEALDREYFYGAADRGLGAFYAKAPEFAGGDLKKAWEHFKKSHDVAPHYFGTNVLVAEYYATKKQDKALFEKVLKEVIKADPMVYPDIVPEQKAEQANAKALLARMDDLFE